MKFALITEGISEYRVINHILSRYFRELDPEINQIQPKILDEKQETPGGWVEVLKYCERKEIADIFVENDYLIIQIDSDQSETAPFSVLHTQKTGEPKTQQELVDEITQKLHSLIDPPILEKHQEKIILAICVHSIECWLLVVYDKQERDNLRNCLHLLNREIEKKNIDQINPKSKNSPRSIKSYDQILKNLKKSAEIKKASTFNYSFSVFIDYLDNIMLENSQEEVQNQPTP